MTILTIYNHGTGGSRTKDASKGEIVNIFGNNAVGVEGTDYLITEGVGKKGSPHLTLHIQENLSGSVRAVPTVPGAARVRDVLNKVSGRLVGKILSKMPEDAMLQASGIGADENVSSVLNILTAMARANLKPERINMMGWSRGAVTCIRIAYFMNLVPALASIPLNIFAVDPVAGQGHADEIDAHTVSSNVRNYIATLSVDENRATFGPSDLRTLSFHRNTVYAILPLPGIHSDTAKSKTASGKITFHLLAKFLNFHGSPNNASAQYLLGEHELVRLYELISSRDEAARVSFGGQSTKNLLIKSGQLFGTSRDVAGEIESSDCYNVHQLAVDQRRRVRPAWGRSGNSYLSNSMMRAILFNGLV